MHRRSLLLLLAIAAVVDIARGEDGTRPPQDSAAYVKSVRAYLSDRVYSRQEIDDWLAPKESAFSQFDARLGYRMANRVLPEGIDGALVRYRYTNDGARRMMAYVDRPCRINTYGSSFTDCEQTGDAETWQEFLAGHLEEPVRNYGIGGQTAYQSYVRMVREEGRTPADYIVFNLTPPYERQLVGWQALFYSKSEKHLAPPIPSVRVNSARNAFEERPNPSPTRAALYQFCDVDWVYTKYRDDFVLQIQVARHHAQQGRAELSFAPIMRLSANHGRPRTITTSDQLRDACDALMRQESLYATIRTIEKVSAFAKSHNKRVLFVLTYPRSDIERTVRSGKRFDQPIVDHLVKKKLSFVDLMSAFDRARAGAPVESFLAPYYVGHHSPLGNAFVAYAIKDGLVTLMEPKPRPYRRTK